MKSVTGIVILLFGIIALLNYAPSPDASPFIVAFLWLLCFFSLGHVISSLME